MSKNIPYKILALILVLISGMLIFAFLKNLQNTNAQPANNTTFREPTTSPSESFSEPFLPLPSVVQMQATTEHLIPLAEITRICHSRDCFKAIFAPEFLPAQSFVNKLASSSLGIWLAVEEQNRFYPFPILESHLVVNDTIAGKPVLITYSPLTGTAAVFAREINQTPIHFGVSGMVWQSNLLLYNQPEPDIPGNLWSQILQKAVVGPQSGQPLELLPSNVITFAQWLNTNPTGDTLANGEPTDLYAQTYFAKAKQYSLNFANTEPDLAPEDYVYGIVINDQAKAYKKSDIPVGTTHDELTTEKIIINKKANGQVTFKLIRNESTTDLPAIETFWFSWKAAHPTTFVWEND